MVATEVVGGKRPNTLRKNLKGCAGIAAQFSTTGTATTPHCLCSRLAENGVLVATLPHYVTVRLCKSSSDNTLRTYGAAAWHQRAGIAIAPWR
jgi:hypothetical protein